MGVLGLPGTLVLREGGEDAQGTEVGHRWWACQSPRLSPGCSQKLLVTVLMAPAQSGLGFLPLHLQVTAGIEARASFSPPCLTPGGGMDVTPY